jgi:hypothetical protein
MEVKICTWKPLADLMSYLATKMPHFLPFVGSKGDGDCSDIMIREVVGSWQMLVLLIATIIKLHKWKWKQSLSAKNTLLQCARQVECG